MCSRVGIQPQLGVHPAEPRVEHAAHLVEGEIRHEHLSHLPDQDEAFAAHGKCVPALDIAREDQRQLISGADLIVGWDRAVQ